MHLNDTIHSKIKELVSEWTLVLYPMQNYDTVELQMLEHLWNNENMFDAGVVRANEC